LKRFAWNTEYYPDVVDRNVVGWIAQSVEEVLPKAVTKTTEYGFEDFRSLDVDQVYKMHYGATRKLIIDKEILEEKVTTLQNQLNALLNQLNIVL